MAAPTLPDNVIAAAQRWQELYGTDKPIDYMSEEFQDLLDTEPSRHLAMGILKWLDENAGINNAAVFFELVMLTRNFGRGAINADAEAFFNDVVLASRDESPFSPVQRMYLVEILQMELTPLQQAQFQKILGLGENQGEPAVTLTTEGLGPEWDEANAETIGEVAEEEDVPQAVAAVMPTSPFTSGFAQQD